VSQGPTIFLLHCVVIMYLDHDCQFFLSFNGAMHIHVIKTILDLYLWSQHTHISGRNYNVFTYLILL